MQQIYEPFSRFVVRAPAKPLGQAYDALAARASKVIVAQDPVLREAIAVSAPRLIDAESRARVGSGQDHERVAEAWRRYLVRMSSRPTPLGLFAGAAVGTFGSPAALSLGPVRSFRKRTRPDMRWLLGVVKDLEAEGHIRRELRVSVNPAILRVGSRFDLAFAPTWAEPETAPAGRKNISIRATQPVGRALVLAGDEPSIRDLNALLIADFPDAGHERIEALVDGLVQNHFLITELVPRADASDALDQVITVLTGISTEPDALRPLMAVRAKLDAYDTVTVGEGSRLLQDLTQTMGRLRQATPAVQVDLTYPAAKITLPQEVGDELARAADCLWRLSPASTGLPHLRSYHRAFLERFGAWRPIPILELLSDGTGLGPPEAYAVGSNTLEPSAPSQESPMWRALTERAVAALIEHRDEVVLTDEFVASFASPHSPSSVPAGLEIFAELVAPSAAAVDDGQYRLMLSPFCLSHGAGKSYGRFGDVLDPSVVEQLKLHHEHEQEESEAPIYAQLALLPMYARSANLTQVPTVSRFQITVGTRTPRGPAHEIPLSGIVVFASPERLHLASQSHKRNLVVATGHMLNTEGMPDVCRLLLEISLEDVRLPAQIAWDRSRALPRYPRLKYGKVVLAAQTWYVTAVSLAVGPEATPAEWLSAFRDWCGVWSLPSIVHLHLPGERLLLHISNEHDAAQVQREVRIRGRARLTEVIGGEQDAALRGDEGGHILECVVSLRRAQRIAHAGSATPRLRTSSTDAAGRVRFPGSNWLYLKLYGSERRQDQLLREWVVPFCTTARTRGDIASWFYMRYADPAPHIRLRFRGQPPKLAGLFLETDAWARKLATNGLLHSVTIGTYDREVERYGGPTLIGHAEDVFAADSEFCCGILQLQRRAAPIPSTRTLAALAIVDLGDRTGLWESASDWGQDRAVSSGLLTRPVKAVAARLWLPELPLRLADEEEWEASLLRLVRERGPALDRYGQLIRGGSARDRVADVSSSLAHMHCNRLGLVGENERVSIALAARIHDWRRTMSRDHMAGVPSRHNRSE